MNVGSQPPAESSRVEQSSIDEPAAEREPSVAGPIPRWAWAFVAACAAIPIWTVGGPLWIALGAGSAFACTNVARDETRPLKTRLLQCGAITLFCWILFLLVVFVLARIVGPPPAAR
jgi:hypothetical protein